jgi:predicted lipase
MPSHRPRPSQQLYFLSAASYCSDAELTKWSCGAQCTRSGLAPLALEVFDNGVQRGYVAAMQQVGNREETMIAVVFEGTEKLSDWIENIRVVKTDRHVDGCDGCEVHSGFHDCWTTLADAMVPAIRRLREEHPRAPLHVTGHSKGAAAAVFATWELNAKYGLHVDTCYTFGEPRVGNKNFAEQAFMGQARTAHWRVTHDRDIVPHLPPKSFGFHHMATEVYYKDGDDHKVCSGSGEDAHCSDGNWFDVSVGDHLEYFGHHIGEQTCGHKAHGNTVEVE